MSSHLLIIIISKLIGKKRRGQPTMTIWEKNKDPWVPSYHEMKRLLKNRQGWLQQQGIAFKRWWLSISFQQPARSAYMADFSIFFLYSHHLSDLTLPHFSSLPHTLYSPVSWATSWSDLFSSITNSCIFVCMFINTNILELIVTGFKRMFTLF